MKQLVFLFFSIMLLACQKSEVKTKIAEKPRSVEFARDSTYAMKDPAMMLGTDFFNYFIACYRLMRYDDMMHLTSQQSLREHGQDRVKKFYQEEFNLGEQGGYVLIAKIQTGDNPTRYDLRYKSMSNNLVEKIITIPVMEENDTIKIVLPNNLSDFYYKFADK